VRFVVQFVATIEKIEHFGFVLPKSGKYYFWLYMTLLQPTHRGRRPLVTNPNRREWNNSTPFPSGRRLRQHRQHRLRP
jgi:hypothetical protein